MTNTRARRRSAPPAPPPTRSWTWLWWVAGAAVLAVFLVAVLLSQGDGTSVGEFGDPEITGPALPGYADGVADAAVGTAIPTVIGASFDGSQVTIEPGEGALAVAFLAHWCPHCQSEVQLLEAWLDDGGADDLAVTFRSVATGTNATRDNYPPSEWLDREGWSVPVIADDAAGSVATAYGLSAFPYWVIADADGNVTARRAGAVGIDELRALIAAAGG